MIGFFYILSQIMLFWLHDILLHHLILPFLSFLFQCWKQVISKTYWTVGEIQFILDVEKQRSTLFGFVLQEKLPFQWASLFRQRLSLWTSCRYFIFWVIFQCCYINHCSHISKLGHRKLVQPSCLHYFFSSPSLCTSFKARCSSCYGWLCEFVAVVASLV